ncbi:PilT/PilU family type 4a pilus ATPase [Alkalicella caledoniensis]|uniref:PilT/PilU family type 4a pilus ATPase n=1 Tax=Alkalicella caledoniensis TaxID=2731377 RepID=A0A7G9WBP4_ALKCA|nr:PilT/PilU family type 4a pilus ATPase [Alkalicella caledoniensis]QNO16106.1 PilT/PilU family type 4a pilus ATPase [Alkalicella caledoniensis]
MSIISILENACKRDASDIHLTYGSPVIYRIQGSLVTVNADILTEETLKEYAYTLLRRAGLFNNGEKIENVKEIDFSFDLDAINRFRVNIFRQRGYYSIAARVIPTNIPNWGTLGLPDSAKDFAQLKKGLVLVTGPTGSGKSTTLASLLNIINEQHSSHIITLEDPIEFLHRNKKSIVNQREVGKDSDSFKDGLRAAMRQDPDVILVGEMRDFETIQTAITAAETGHLVFATLHTVSAAKTIDRIIDVFPPDQQNQIRIQLADTLRGVLAQQLVPTVDKRRTVAVELLKVNTAVKNLIREGKNFQIQSILETGSKQGMCTMVQSLRNLLYDGMISEPIFNEYYQSE